MTIDDKLRELVESHPNEMIVFGVHPERDCSSIVVPVGAEIRRHRMIAFDAVYICAESQWDSAVRAARTDSENGGGSVCAGDPDE